MGTGRAAIRRDQRVGTTRLGREMGLGDSMSHHASSGSPHLVPLGILHDMAQAPVNELFGRAQNVVPVL
jgi:hypothetical protein